MRLDAFELRLLGAVLFLCGVLLGAYAQKVYHFLADVPGLGLTLFVFIVLSAGSIGALLFSEDKR